MSIDILANLPPEIVEMVVQYLPLYQSFQLRRVSRIWQEKVFSSHILQRRMPLNPQLHIPRGLSKERVISLNAEHTDAFSSGQAFSVTLIEDINICTLKGCSSYSAGAIAWIDPRPGAERRACKRLDLRTGEMTSCFTESREALLQVALSRSIMAAVSLSGNCHVWTLQTMKRDTFKLPSAQVHKLFITDGTVIVALATGTATMPANVRSALFSATACLEIVVWHSHDKRSHSFLLTLPMIDDRSTRIRTHLIVDEDGKSILFCRLSLSQSRIAFIRTSLQGSIEAQGTFEIPKDRGIASDCRSRLRELDGAQGTSCPTLWIILGDSKSTFFGCPILRLQYDWELSKYVVDMHIMKGLDDTDWWSDSYRNHDHLHMWNDIAYHAMTDQIDESPPPDLMVMDFRNSASTSAPMISDMDYRQALTNVYKGHRGLWSDWHSSKALIYGDSIFQLHLFKASCLIWCFDKHVKMPNRITEYENLRESRLQECIQAKRRSLGAD